MSGRLRFAFRTSATIGTFAVVGTFAAAACAAPTSDSRIPIPSPTAAPMPSPTASAVSPLAGTPTFELYLPYLTKTLGGPDGWETPFILQNTDTDASDLELSFYRIADGSLALRRVVRGLRPGTSYADRPNADADLGGDAAYSLVVRSFGAKLVAVVNEQRGSGERFEADAYTSENGGSRNTFIPRVRRAADGFRSRIVVQNADAEPTVVTAAFLRSSGEVAATVRRDLLPGRAAVIDVGDDAAIPDGEFSVRLTAPGRLIAIVNNHRDEPSDIHPMLYTHKAIIDGANNVYGPYASKGARGIIGTSAVAVQNMGAQPTNAALTFTPLGGGATTRFDGPPLAPGAAWTFDLAFRVGDRTQPACGVAASTGCLADGEYSFVAGAPGGQLAALITTLGASRAAAYAALARPGHFFLPNVTRTLGGSNGWTTPVVVQSATAVGFKMSWYRFADGGLAVSQELPISPGTARWVDPRTVLGLPEDSQYAVVVEGIGGRLVAIVVELRFGGGDGAAIYEGSFH